MTSLVHRRERAFLVFAYVVAAVVATYICGIAQQCNNFHIFRSAFANLLAGRDLYAPHPAQHWDLFKYSPTFALLFAPFALLPFTAALLFWNLLNVLSVHFAVRRLLPDHRGTAALALLYPGLVATLDGTQSNGLVAATIVIAWVALEQRSFGGQLRAALAITTGALVKIFPLAALSFVLPHRQRGRFAVVFLALALSAVLLPLLVTSPAALIAQYGSWSTLEQVDALDRGASVMHLLQLTGYAGPNWPLQLAGTLLLVAPLLRHSSRVDAAFRRDFLCSLLVYSVIFNHKAEQPSFVIALIGVVVWYAAALKLGTRNVNTRNNGVGRTVLLSATLVVMLPVFVAAIAPRTFGEYAALPLLAAAGCCTLAWLWMQCDLWRLAPERTLYDPSSLLGLDDDDAARAGFAVLPARVHPLEHFDGLDTRWIERAHRGGNSGVVRRALQHTAIDDVQHVSSAADGEAIDLRCRHRPSIRRARRATPGDGE